MDNIDSNVASAKRGRAFEVNQEKLKTCFVRGQIIVILSLYLIPGKDTCKIWGKLWEWEENARMKWGIYIDGVEECKVWGEIKLESKKLKKYLSIYYT